MAFYKHVKHLAIRSGSEFDDIHAAGEIAPLSGIYRCEGCQRSVVARNGSPLPSATHHRHDDGGPISWRLVASSFWP